MNRQDYLERARECLDMADKMRGEDKKKLLQIADAWRDLADDMLAHDLRAGIDVSPPKREPN
jgi:hypothetical protein